MPKLVEVPDVGEVEFPDEMNDDQIVQAIRGFSTAPQEPPVSDVEVPATPPVAAPASPEQVTVDEFEGFEKLSPVERSQIVAQAEVDLMNSRKRLEAFGAPMQPEANFGTGKVGFEAVANLIGDPEARKAAQQDFEQKLGRFGRLLPRYEELTPIGQDRAAAALGAKEQERIRAEFEASGQGPNFLESGLSYLTGKAENLAAGVAETFAPSAPALSDVARDLAIEGKGQQEFSMINRGAGASVMRGVGDVAMLALGNPAGNAAKAISSIAMKAANEAYGATLGQTGGDRGAAQEAAQKAYRDTAVYMGLGMGTSRAVQATLPKDISPFRAAVLSGTGAAGANVATSFGMAAARGEEYGLQQLTADLVMGGVEGGQTFKRVKAEQPAAPPRPSIEQPPAKDLTELGTPEQRGEPEPAPELQSKVIGTAIELPDGGLERGTTWNQSHAEILRTAIGKSPDIEKDFPDRLGFAVQLPDGSIVWRNRTESMQIAKDQGLVSQDAGTELTSEMLAGKEQPSEQPPSSVPSTSEPPPSETPPPPSEPPILTPESPPSPSSGEPIGAYNAKMDEQRAARGLPPLMGEARQSNQQTWDAAQARIQQNPDLPRVVTEEILSGKRKAVNTEDQAMLVWRMVDLHNKRDAEAQKINDPNVSEAARLDAESAFRTYEEDLGKTEEASRKFATEWGRTGQFRQRLVHSNFTLAAMEARQRVAKGEPLTPQEVQQIKEQQEGIQKNQEVINRLENEEPIDAAVKQIEIESSKDPAFTPEARSLADRIVERLEKAAEGSNERIRGLLSELGGKLGSGPDIAAGVKLVKELAVRAALEIGKLGIKSTLKFTRWGTKMVKEFGEGIKPFLREAWDRADQVSEGAAAGKTLRGPITDVEKAQKALDAAVVERERVDMMLAGELAPAKKQSREALTQLEEDMRAEIQAMRGLAAETRKSERPKADPETVRENAQVAALERAAAEYERQLNNADLGGRGKRQGADTARVAKARALRDAVKKARDAARELANPPKTKEQRDLENFKKRKQKQADEIQRRTEAKDFTPKERKKSDIAKHPEAIKAQMEVDRFKREYDRQLEEHLRANETLGKKALRGARDAVQSTRNIEGMGDVSALRQALPAIRAFPITSLKNIGTLVKSFFSEKVAQRSEAKRQLRENFRNGTYEQSGLSLSPLSETRFSKTEENLRSRLEDWANLDLRKGNIAARAGKVIPKVIGQVARMSNRAFVSFLNDVRVNVFDQLLATKFKDTPPTKQELLDLGEMVNTLTGRGLKNNSRLANWLLYSPNFLVARLKNMSQYHVWKPGSTMRVRKMALGIQMKQLASWMLIYGAVRLFSDKNENDITKSDFGKMRDKNTRIDYTAGEAGLLTLGARIFQGVKNTVQGKKQDRNMREQMFQQYRYKAAPFASAVLDWVTGETVDYKKTTAGGTLKKLYTPMSWGEVSDTAKDVGITKAAWYQLQNLFGAGVNTYERQGRR